MSALDSPAKPASRLFGTDGIRGPAGTPPLDRRSLLRLGRALGKILARDSPSPKAILAGDTRGSTPEICGSLAAGLEERGCEILYGGVLPTPAVSRLCRTLSATVGIAVSASHNPFPDNGIKLLNALGFKWSRERERELEEAFALESETTAEDLNELNKRVDRLRPLEELGELYLEELASLFPERSLGGLSVVLDTAHGAASGLAGRFFSNLGAEVSTLGDAPDGSNINLGCGSTEPDQAMRQTISRGANLGFAFDGDADRALAIDGSGMLHDGDAMLFVLATWLYGTGRLDPPRVVATSMSNLGLEVALETHGIGLVRCDVGDRAVVEALKAEGLVLGGEQAGHIVHLGMSATGDGLLSAALVARAVHSSGLPLSKLAAGFQRFPQILRNLEVPAKPDFASLPRVMSEVERIERELGDRGRLVLRYSGTEPLARVMIEGLDQKRIEALAEGLATTIAEEIEALRGGE